MATTYRLTVSDPEKYRAFQVWSYRLHPHLAAQQAVAPLVPVGHVHAECTDIAAPEVLEKHGLVAELVG